VVLSEALAPFAPVPFVRQGENGLELVEHIEGEALGRVTAFHGQMGMYVRALTYMLSHGGDGLAQAAQDAVLNANYIKARLGHVFSVPFPDYPAMHEALFDDGFLKDTGVTTLDFAKALIDEGFHPMTMYFPLVVHGAMLVEPTESESKQTLDRFCDVVLELAQDARSGNAQRFTDAPLKAPRRRLDETRAARQPILKWEKPAELPKAAE
jgi:glycine dehydrogenase subunit 2